MMYIYTMHNILIFIIIYSVRSESYNVTHFNEIRDSKTSTFYIKQSFHYGVNEKKINNNNYISNNVFSLSKS